MYMLSSFVPRLFAGLHFLNSVFAASVFLDTVQGRSFEELTWPKSVTLSLLPPISRTLLLERSFDG